MPEDNKLHPKRKFENTHSITVKFKEFQYINLRNDRLESMTRMSDKLYNNAFLNRFTNPFLSELYDDEREWFEKMYSRYEEKKSNRNNPDYYYMRDFKQQKWTFPPSSSYKKDFIRRVLSSDNDKRCIPITWNRTLMNLISRAKIDRFFTGTDKLYLCEDQTDAFSINNKFIYIFQHVKGEHLDTDNNVKLNTKYQVETNGNKGVKLETKYKGKDVTFFFCLSTISLPPKRIKFLQHNIDSFMNKKGELCPRVKHIPLKKPKKNNNIILMHETLNKPQFVYDRHVKLLKNEGKKIEIEIYLADHLTLAEKWKKIYDDNMKTYLGHINTEGDRKQMRDIIYQVCQKSTWRDSLPMTNSFWKQHITPQSERDLKDTVYNERILQDTTKSYGYYVAYLLLEGQLEQVLWDFCFKDKKLYEKGAKKYQFLISNIGKVSEGLRYLRESYEGSKRRMVEVLKKKGKNVKVGHACDNELKYAKTIKSALDLYQNKEIKDEHINFKKKPFAATLIYNIVGVHKSIAVIVLNEFAATSVTVEYILGTADMVEVDLNKKHSTRADNIRDGKIRRTYIELFNLHDSGMRKMLSEVEYAERGTSGSYWVKDPEKLPPLKILCVNEGTQGNIFQRVKSSGISITFFRVLANINVAINFYKLKTTKYKSNLDFFADLLATMGASFEFANAILRLDSNLMQDYNALKTRLQTVYNVSDSEARRILRNHSHKAMAGRVIGITSGVIDILMGTYEAYKLSEKEDYDAAFYGGGMQIAGGIIGIAAAITESWFLAILAVASLFGANLLKGVFADKPIEIWMKYCIYGNKHHLLRDHKNNLSQIIHDESWAPNKFEGWYNKKDEGKNFPVLSMAQQLAALNRIIFAPKVDVRRSDWRSVASRSGDYLLLPLNSLSLSLNAASPFAIFKFEFFKISDSLGINTRDKLLKADKKLIEKNQNLVHKMIISSKELEKLVKKGKVHLNDPPLCNKSLHFTFLDKFFINTSHNYQSLARSCKKKYFVVDLLKHAYSASTNEYETINLILKFTFDLGIKLDPTDAESTEIMTNWAFFHLPIGDANSVKKHGRYLD